MQGHTQNHHASHWKYHKLFWVNVTRKGIGIRTGVLVGTGTSTGIGFGIGVGTDIVPSQLVLLLVLVSVLVLVAVAVLALVLWHLFVLRLLVLIYFLTFLGIVWLINQS